MHMNFTGDTMFFLVGFPELHEFQYVMFSVFLIFFILTIIGNILIIALVQMYHHLHSPMYFFLCHLSLSDIISITDIVPNMLYVLWEGGSPITFVACLTQFQVYGESICIVCILLAVMSYDRYLAVCKPLHYSSIMDISRQHTLVTLTWLITSLIMLIVLVQLSQLQFRDRNVIDHYFCDFDPILVLSCNDVTILKVQSFLSAGVLIVPPFIFIVLTYFKISFAILKISSITTRQKAFYTCSSHLAAVCVFYGSLTAIYLSSSHGHTMNLNKFLSLFNTVGTPLLNPIIYSLRNKEIKSAIWKLIEKLKDKYPKIKY